MSITNEAVIFGTSISLKATRDAFSDFIASCVLAPVNADGEALDAEADAEAQEPYYRRMLRDMARSEQESAKHNVNIDIQHIRSHGENGKLL